MTLAFDAAATPGDAAWAAWRTGELAFGSGDVSGAASWYRRGLELDPAFVPNLAGTAKVAWSRGDDRLAIERYREVTARYPSPEFVVALADLYRVTGRDDLADEQEAVMRALHELADGNGVNADLELAVFDADHGEERGALVAARAEWSRRRSVPRRRRARVGAVRERALRAGRDLRRPSPAARHRERDVPVPRRDDPARARRPRKPRASSPRRGRQPELLDPARRRRNGSSRGSRTRDFVRRLATLLAVVGVVMLVPATPSATPLGNHGQPVRGDRARPGEVGSSTSSTWPRSPRSRSDREVDADGDGSVSTTEGAAWADRTATELLAASRSRSTARRFASVSAPRR